MFGTNTVPEHFLEYGTVSSGYNGIQIFSVIHINVASIKVWLRKETPI